MSTDIPDKFCRAVSKADPVTEREKTKRKVTSDLHVISFVFRPGTNLIAEERLSLQELCLLCDRAGPGLLWRIFFSDAVGQNRKKKKRNTV